MVNVPPLLCSTPPPIDFGEEDEDLDVMPPTLDGVDDEEFGDFLTEDNNKNDEPLPSPRPSSVSDLPSVSIYDGLPPPEEDLPNQQTPPQTEEHKRKDKTNNIPNIAEAFNYNIKNTNEEANDKTKDQSSETLTTEKLNTNSEDKTEIQKSNENQNDLGTKSANLEVTQPIEAKNTNRNPKDLKIETSNLENKCNSDKTGLSSMQNVVSIEDIEDDLSDDELYSPRTPKNFTDTDNMQDYFKIQLIKDGDIINKNQSTTKVISKDADTKSVDSLDNNESAEVEIENDYKSCSSNSFQQNTFDLPPPLDDQSNSFDDNDDDDDFGDFADFQDFSAAITPSEIKTNVDNTVPVNDSKNMEPQFDYDDTKENDFNDFINHNSQIESTEGVNTKMYDGNENKSPDLNVFKQPEQFKDSIDDDEFDDFNSHTDEFKNDDIKEFKQNSLENERIEENKFDESLQKSITSKIVSSISQDNLNDAPEINKTDTLNVEGGFGDFNEPPPLTDEPSSLDDNFGDFSEAPELNLHDVKNDIKDCKENPTNFKTPAESNNDDDDFNDFADFEHQEIPKIEQKQFGEIKDTAKQTVLSKDDIDFDDDDDDDDDFGDFNTAEPITPTASTFAPVTTTSQNISTTATPMLTPKNLNERISKILQLMFNPPISNIAENTAEPKANKIQDIPFTSIDAAKALEYQWLNSDTRHSFIKSLGIDSKNILYGENWNPSLPRFAANLSFNPLKPMKPVLMSGNTTESCSILEPVSANTTETKKSSSMNSSNSINKETIDIDWKSTNMTEQTKEAFKDNKLSEVPSSALPAATSLPYVSNEPPTEPVSLTIFENSLENEEKFSKTPPISEMESVTTFSSPLPTTTTSLEMELPTMQIINNLKDFELTNAEENSKTILNTNDVVVTSTFTGSFKETHIYTPPKTNEFETKQTAVTFSSSPSKSTPIDFDYEKAAMGVVIDETVVKKEYRDVEYNPPFTKETLKSSANKSEIFATNINSLNGNDNNKVNQGSPIEEDESNDDFTEFQSVPSEIPPPQTKPQTVTNVKQNQYLNNRPAEASKPVAAVSHGGMILSPAILIPQAIFMENNKPKIEWGDSSANINAEELARIEELFPEPKSVKSSNTSNSSQKSTPTHQQASTPSISATVANKEMGGGGSSGINNDDDDWSDFVSVPIANNTSTNRNGANNNVLTKSPAGSPFKHRSPVVPHRMATQVHSNNSNNDDEWSDFVSSAPQPTANQQSTAYRVPQFNSGAWQNANFYNNPLSMYHKGPININATAQQSPKHMYNNNNNYNYNIPQQQQHQQQQPQQYHVANNVPPTPVGHHYKPTPQQIHIMQNFSTAPVPTPERLTITAASSTTATARNNQFQVGSAKVAPSIALIPDLGFVAPAIPTHTSFINSLPKPSINTKK